MGSEEFGFLLGLGILELWSFELRICRGLGVAFGTKDLRSLAERTEYTKHLHADYADYKDTLLEIVHAICITCRALPPHFLEICKSFVSTFLEAPGSKCNWPRASGSKRPRS